MSPFSVEKTLIRENLFIFTPEEFRRLFRIPRHQVKYFLETSVRNGVFVRLKKGLYMLKGSQPEEEIIANALYTPSYLSFEYALSKYGIIPESVYTITSATSKATASFSVLGRQFQYFKIQRAAFEGYASVKNSQGQTVLIAEPEKALVDYLYFVSLGKRTLNERLTISGLRREKVISYAKQFKRPGVMSLIKQLYDRQ